MKELLIMAIGCLLIAGFSTTAKAISLSVGGSTTGPFGTNLSIANRATPVKGASLSVPLTVIGPGLSGTLTETVYSDSIGMLFEYQFTNNPGSTKSITEMSASNYSGFTIDVNASENAGSTLIVPSGISDLGIDMAFSFSSAVSPGKSSDYLWIQTNAPGFTAFDDTYFYGNGSTPEAEVLDTLGPSTKPIRVTPEPSTMLMFAISALGLAGLRKIKAA